MVNQIQSEIAGKEFADKAFAGKELFALWRLEVLSLKKSQPAVTPLAMRSKANTQWE
jgi:hypothetical protein